MCSYAWSRYFVCVCLDVMYSGEYNVSDVTLSVFPHREQAEKFAWPPWESNPRPLDISPMLCQLSYEVKSVRVHGIAEISLVPSISMCSYAWSRYFFCVCFDVMYSGEYNVSGVTLSVYPHRAVTSYLWDFDSHQGQANFSACLVSTYTQSIASETIHSARNKIWKSVIL